MKKLWMGLIAAGLVAAVSVPVIVSVTKNNNKTEQENVYAAYVVYAEAAGDKALSYEDWLKTVKGEKGDKGDKGDAGVNGDKGEKGDKGDRGEAGKDGKDGKDGKSAYEIWLENGNSGTEADFLEWLKGQQGEKGDKGDKGDPGSKGEKGNAGSKGDKGEAGRGIASMEINDNGELIVTYTDGTTENLGVTGGQKRYIVRVYYVGDELWAEYSDGISEKISVDGGSTCKHENATYIEQVCHTMKADGTFTNGIYLMMCPDCQLSKTISDVIHNFVVMTVKPTCTDDGYTYKECAICGYEADKEKTDDALGHDYDIRPSKSGSEAREWCINCGETDRYCTRCKEIIETFELEPRDAIGHVSDKWSLVSSPSYDTSGTISGLCKYCGTFAEKRIPPCCDGAYTVSNIFPEGASCGERKTGTFTIEIDGQVLVIKNVEIPASLHTLNGELINPSANGGVLMFDDDAAFAASGMTLFSDNTLSCAMSAPAQFTCEVCDHQVLVRVQKRHTRPTDPNEITVKKEVTCEEYGEWEYSCKECCTGDVKVTEVIPALGHDLQYTFVQDTEGYSLHAECKRECGYQSDYIGLRDVSVTIVRPATCEKEGLGRYNIVLSDGKTMTIDYVIPKLDHTLLKKDGTRVSIPLKDVNGDDIAYAYDDFKDDVTLFGDTQVTCKNNFTGQFTCAECGGDVLITLYAPHTAPEGTGTNIPAATCTEDKIWNDYVCSICGQEVRGEVVEKALGHNIFYIPDYEDETIINGYCSRCDDRWVIKFDKAPTYSVIKPATCNETGIGEYKGYVNGELKSCRVTLVKAAHTTASGKKYYTMDTAPSTDKDIQMFADQAPGCGEEPAIGQFLCSVCNQKVLVKVKSPHSKPDIIDETNIKAPTCTESGWIKYDCARCDQKDITEITDPLGHDLTAKVENDMIVITCKTEGCPLNSSPVRSELKPFDYKVNGKNYYTEIEKVDATCKSDGYIKYSFTYTYSYTVQWRAVYGDIVKSETKEVEFKDLIAFKLFMSLGHVHFVTETNDEGYEVDKIFVKDVEKEVDGNKVIYIGKYKQCRECGEFILIGELTPKAEEEASAGA